MFLLQSENKTISDLVENKPSEEELKIAQDDINAEIKRKYEEMRRLGANFKRVTCSSCGLFLWLKCCISVSRNALANEEKEKRNSSSPQSPSNKRKDRGRSKYSSTSHKRCFLFTSLFINLLL